MTGFRLLFSVLNSAKPQLLGSQIFSFFTIFFNVALLATSAWLISTAGLHPPLEALGLAIVGVRFYGISRAVSRYVERYLSHSMAFQGLYSLRTWFYGKIEPLGPALFKQYGTGDLLNRLMGDIEILQFFYVRVLVPPVTAVLSTLLFGWYISLFSGTFLVLLIVAFLTAGILIPIGVLKSTGKSTKVLHQQKSQVKEELTETISGMLDIVAYNARNAVTTRLQSAFARSDECKYTVGHRNAIGGALFLSVVQFTMIGALWIGAQMWIGKPSEGVYIAVLAIAFQAYFEALQPMIEAFHAGKDSHEAVGRLQAIHKEVPEVQENSEKSVPIVSNEIVTSVPAIAFSKLDFSYGNQRLFTDFRLTVQNGERVAVVGPSGSGKTTLISLLERFYEYSGSLQVNGQELRNKSAEWAQLQFGTMTQNPYIFHATLEDNIRLAKPNATTEELEKACQLAELKDLIASLPMGLQTVIGSGGRHLSGGERQRVALGRIFLSDKPILLLDEPLEQLDQITRSRIRKSLWTAMEGKTILLITHQLKGLESMDRIVFLENGQILESGTFSELMAKKGEFFKYVRLSETIA